MNLFSRRREERDARAWEQIAPVLKASEEARWRQTLSDFETRYFVQAKWNITLSWNLGVPPRPCSAEELAMKLGLDVDSVRERDWALVDRFRDMRRSDPVSFRFLAVPVDVAQEWWDAEFKRLFEPDGTPRHSPLEGDPEPPLKANPTAHEIEDPAELQRHMLEDHDLPYAKDPRALGTSHRVEHRDAAEDAEWDRLLRNAPSQGFVE